MTLFTRTRSLGTSSQGYPATSLSEESGAVQPRFVGNALARRHTTRARITWPEKYHERYRLPSGIEQQPF